MPPNPRPGGAVRSATAVNEEIRALVESGADGVWPAEEYEVLLLRWEAAVREDVVEAA